MLYDKKSTFLNLFIFTELKTQYFLRKKKKSFYYWTIT